MTYKLVVTNHAEELLDKLVYYLLYQFKSEQAAKHLLDGIISIYDRIETNPFQFPSCQDAYLKRKGYHEALVPDMNYILVFRIEKNTVYVLGVFHQSEKYESKI
jgi:plasmid stabilization system protein ParE